MAAKESLISSVAGAKPYLQDLVGVFLVINAIGLMTYSIGSGVLMMLAALLVFPRVQAAINQHTSITLHPLLLIAVFGILFVSSSALLLAVVDMSQAPDFLKPFEQ